jgi:hypothetical protein
LRRLMRRFRAEPHRATPPIEQMGRPIFLDQFLCLIWAGLSHFCLFVRIWLCYKLLKSEQILKFEKLISEQILKYEQKNKIRTNYKI